MPKNIKLDSDGLKFYGDAENKVTLNAPASLTSDTQVLFPTSSGTLALTSDITGGDTAQRAYAAGAFSKTNDTYADVTGIAFTATSGVVYDVEVMFYMGTGAANFNHKIRFLNTYAVSAIGSALALGTTTTSATAARANLTAGCVFTHATNGDDNVVTMRGYMEATSTGDVQLQFAQSATNATASTIDTVVLKATPTTLIYA